MSRVPFSHSSSSQTLSSRRWEDRLQNPYMAYSWLVLAGLCLVAVAGRMWIEVPNFKPTMAIALLSGVIFRDWKMALFAPLASMLLTDVWLGTYEWPVMVSVYGCMLAPVAWSRLFDRQAESHALARLINWNVGGLAAALLFFVVTNFACWAATAWYPKTLVGLGECYWAALPFLKWMLLGNFFFVTTIGGSWLLGTSLLARKTATFGHFSS